MHEDPWEKLAAPLGPGMVTASRVDAEIAWDFFWALDADQKCLLVLRHSASASSENPLPRLKGIEVSIVSDPAPGKSMLLFKLMDPKQRDLFYHLVRDIVASTAGAESERAAVNLALNRTWRWHHLLRGGASDLLSQEEQTGLIGELLVLIRYVLGQFPAAMAIASWTGPFDAPKDFEIGKICIECKARRGAATPFITISSEFQLDEAGIDSLFLHIVDLTLAPSTSVDNINLTELANSVRDAITSTDPGAIIGFESALAAVGFRWEDDYTDSRWIEGTSRLYQVRDDFPRITSDEMRIGVSNVRYSISLTECEPFKIDRFVLDDDLRRSAHRA